MYIIYNLLISGSLNLKPTLITQIVHIASDNTRLTQDILCALFAIAISSISIPLHTPPSTLSIRIHFSSRARGPKREVHQNFYTYIIPRYYLVYRTGEPQ
uniref:Uncharacterized protein n=1 Tax=Cacopsylla melanoneura TaxID=428564 RepID=A0A8D8RNR3_9HEMI